MISNEILLTFIATSCVACLLPGPAVLYAIGTTFSHGLRSGFIAILGLQLGFFVQIFAASSGLSAILLTSGKWFSILKIFGAIYLVYLGLSLLFSKKGDKDFSGSSSFVSKRSFFLKGVLINVLNPKILIFFISYILQFITNNGVSAIQQLFILGIIFCIIGTITTIFYALFGNAIGRYVSHFNICRVFGRWLPGSLFIGFGLKLVFTDRP